MDRIENKRLLIVGGSSGIGYAVAEQALEQGARVTIASRSKERLRDAVAKLAGDARHAVFDTRDFDGVASFFATHDPWDHVVLCGAETPMGSIRDLSLDDARSAMESKFWGAYAVARAARLAERGSLTLVSGLLSTRPSGQAVLQGAINAAVEALGRGLALELSPVRVNTVSPGIIDTPLWSAMQEPDRSAFFSSVAEALPAKTLGSADDVANAILYLLKTPFATGSVVRVDGGGDVV